MKIEKLISAGEAQNIVGAKVSPLSLEKIPFQKANGRILAEDIISDRFYPPFNRSMMDGIALKFSDVDKLPNGLPCKNTSYAGEKQKKLPHGEAIKIMTGAPVPTGADMVIRVERLSFIQGRVFCDKLTGLRPGQNIHPVGSDILKNEIVLTPGKLLTSGDVACLATLGKTSVLVERLPAFAIITTGNELIPPYGTPLDFQIRSSNQYFLESVLRKRGAVISSINVSDELEMIQEAIDSVISKVDCLILCGGVSKGNKDFVYKALENLGSIKLFHRVAQKPGKPLFLILSCINC